VHVKTDIESDLLGTSDLAMPNRQKRGKSKELPFGHLSVRQVQVKRKGQSTKNSTFNKRQSGQTGEKDSRGLPTKNRKEMKKEGL